MFGTRKHRAEWHDIRYTNLNVDVVSAREPFSWRSKMATIKIEGMVCQVCANSVKRTLSAVKGVRNPVVDLEKGEVDFEEEGPIDPNELKAAVERAGYRLC